MLDAPLTIAHAIQLSLAPVFLLAAIAAMLSVFTNRLGRIIDRSRELQSLESWSEPVFSELRALRKRARLAHYAIAFCTSAALCVSLIVAIIFLGFVLSMNMALAVAVLFVSATALFIFALCFLLMEVRLAAACVHTACPVGPPPATGDVVRAAEG
jgi:Na+/melibiose symporter-like transporter